MAGWADARVGDSEREAAAALLREHYAAGSLTLDEFQDRLHAVYAAQVYRDLAVITADLPVAGMTGAGPAGLGSAAGSLRAAMRRVLLLSLAAFAGIAVCLVLLALWVPHGVLLALVAGLLLAPVLLVTAAAAALVWAGRRAWRSGAWLEVLPLAAGMPWLGRVIWAARALLVGRAFWRIGRRAGRPLRSRRTAASYQGQPGGGWQQARVTDPDWTPS
jgi:hypothetical protein